MIHPDQDYLNFLREGRMMLMRSRSSGRHFFPPRVVEPGTGETDIEWVEASGLGTVYSTTVVRQRPPGEDYNVALIDLLEGPRMMSRVDGIAPEKVSIGLEVRASVIWEDEVPKIVFRPLKRTK